MCVVHIAGSSERCVAYDLVDCDCECIHTQRACYLSHEKSLCKLTTIIEWCIFLVLLVTLPFILSHSVWVPSADVQKKIIENCVCNLKQLCQHWLTGILFHWRNAQQRFFCLLSLPLSLEYKYIKNKDINESTSCFVSILCALSDYCCCCCCHVESIFSILKSCNSIWMMPESLSMLLFVRIRIQQ